MIMHCTRQVKHLIFRNILFFLAIIIFAGLAVILVMDLSANVKKLDKHNKKNKSRFEAKANSRKSRFT